MNNKRWLRYGLVGNFLTYGIGTAFLAYMGTCRLIQVQSDKLRMAYL